MATIASPKARISGWVLSGFLGLFLSVDALLKIAQRQPILEASAKLGIGPNTVLTLGVILFVATILYLIPRTAAVGVTLLSAYLGGAIATHMLIHDEPFTYVFPTILGVLLWVGLVLRDRRLRVLLPWA